MTYAVKECFLTLQGEGVQSGSRAVFLRFAGCNLWSGREQDRSSAQCTLCDTDFVGTDGDGGGKFASAQDLAIRVEDLWGAGRDNRLVVITGGEPMLQLDRALVDALHRRDFRIAVETNGTLPATPGIDWICVSPKAGTEIIQRSGSELKLVWLSRTRHKSKVLLYIAVGAELAFFLAGPQANADGAARFYL